MKPKFSIGVKYVRIRKKSKIFDKGYTQRWTEEVFKISKIQLTIPVTYTITDYNGEEIQGSSYEQELQKTKQDIFRIEKIIKQQGIIKVSLNGWGIMIRLTRGLTTKTITHYRAKVRKCVSWISKAFTSSYAL